MTLVFQISERSFLKIPTSVICKTEGYNILKLNYLRRTAGEAYKVTL